MELAMLCNQCEMAAPGGGCTKVGVCGKDPDVESVQEILLYGLKGMAAYAHHARRLGRTDPEVSAFFEDALFATMTNVNFDLDSLVAMALECGRMNLKVMQMLDEAHVERFGRPAPAQVKVGTQSGPGILVTGHDMLDLWNVLEAVRGTDVKVYTHGEMLPAHMYPKLREHPNLAGHFGGAWQKQRREFAEFAGPVLVTTNCVMLPTSYADRLYTLRVVGVPGAQRVADDNYAPLIERARRTPLARQDSQPGTLTVGFHHAPVLDLAGTIVDAVKAGKIRRFFVIGGCDGPENERDYFLDYARNIPSDCFILTLGCGKFRINSHDYGTHLGLPRLMDMGQCNNAYSAIQVAAALAGAFKTSVNDLPLTIVLSWLEQKAVAVLLSLLHLGVKSIRIGPRPPAFVSPNVFKVLQDAFDLKLTGDWRDDLADDLGEDPEAVAVGETVSA